MISRLIGAKNLPACMHGHEEDGPPTAPSAAVAVARGAAASMVEPSVLWGCLSACLRIVLPVHGYRRGL
jgi:hypothetical protein